MATVLKTVKVNPALLQLLNNLEKDLDWASLNPSARLRRSLVAWVRVKETISRNKLLIK